MLFIHPGHVGKIVMCWCVRYRKAQVDGEHISGNHGHHHGLPRCRYVSGDKIEVIVNCPRETDPIWPALTP
jgi:hypothetical protein